MHIRANNKSSLIIRITSNENKTCRGYKIELIFPFLGFDFGKLLKKIMTPFFIGGTKLMYKI